MTPPRDPKTGRFLKVEHVSERTTIAELDKRVKVKHFPFWPWQQCKTAACKLNKGHTGRHARPNGFDVEQW